MTRRPAPALGTTYRDLCVAPDYPVCVLMRRDGESDATYRERVTAEARRQLAGDAWFERAMARRQNRERDTTG